MTYEVRRYISWFNKDGDDTIVDRMYLPDSIPLEKLQTLFGIPTYNPMYDSYDIKNEHVKFFSEYIKIEFDFDSYDYFLNCHAV